MVLWEGPKRLVRSKTWCGGGARGGEGLLWKLWCLFEEREEVKQTVCQKVSKCGGQFVCLSKGEQAWWSSLKFSS